MACAACEARRKAIVEYLARLKAAKDALTKARGA